MSKPKCASAANLNRSERNSRSFEAAASSASVPASFAFAGIDVASAELVLALRVDGCASGFESYPNDPSGIRSILSKLKSLRRPVRICMEATGVYFLEAARALAAMNGAQVMIANPRIIKDFAAAMNRRSKTDTVDAQVIALYAEKAEFVAWEPPGENITHLRLISRRIDDRTKQKAAEKCRLHALGRAGTAPKLVIKDVLAGIKAHEKSIENLRKEAMEIIKADRTLHLRYKLLLTIPGVGPVTALRLIAELSVMPGCLTARQWTAYAGLDPVTTESGSSIKRPSRVSRAGNARIRNALFFAALVASRTNPHVRAFTRRLTERGKKKIQAIVAAMRKLLHAIWGMFRNSSSFDGAVLFPSIPPDELTTQ